MTDPPLTAQQIERIEQAEICSWRAETVGDDGAVAVRTFRAGGLTAFATPGRPNTLFNRAIGIGPDDAEHVAPLLEWYAAQGAHGIAPRIDVSPARKSPQLDAALRAAGLEPGGMPMWARRLMAGPVPADGHKNVPVPGITVREITSDEAGMFENIRQQVWPAPMADLPYRIAGLRASHGQPGVFWYFACIDGRQPVAVGGMVCTDGVAYLCIAATLPEHRRKGCQTALVRQRIADAAAAGCDLVCSLVAPDSDSERNLRRAGLTATVDRELWMAPAWYEHRFYRETTPP
ncbi:MAG: GNAT family N-acetyltransferase [Planctomycetota bacterium]